MGTKIVRVFIRIVSVLFIIASGLYLFAALFGLVCLAHSAGNVTPGRVLGVFGIGVAYFFCGIISEVIRDAIK